MGITGAVAVAVLASVVATGCSGGDSRAGGDLYDEATGRCVSAAADGLQFDEEDLRASLEGRDVEEFVFVTPGDLSSLSDEELQTFSDDTTTRRDRWLRLRSAISDEGEVGIGWAYFEAFDRGNGLTSEGKAELYLRAEITGGSWFCKVEWEPDFPARQPWDEARVRLEP